MSKASLSNGTGPGSSISLAPETVRIRDALIKKFSDAPLEDMTNFMAVALSNETDELRRLGILAARIYILRHRVANLKEFNRNPSLTSMPEVDTTSLSHNLATASEPAMNEDVDLPNEIEQWSRIQMTEPGEVNGVRFLTGTIIDAQTHDADKLINSGKAVRVDMDGDIIDHHDDNLTDSDETAETVGDGVSTPTLSDDSKSVPTTSDDAPISDEPQEVEDSQATASDGATQTANNADDAPMSDEPQEVKDAEANDRDGATQTANNADEDTKAPTS